MNKQITDIKQFKTQAGKVNYALGYLKERIDSIIEETGIDLGRLIETLYLAYDDVEEVAWEKFTLAENKDQGEDSLYEIRQEINAALKKRTVNMDRIYKDPPDKEPKKITASHVDLVLSYLKDKTKELAKKTQMDQLYYLEKMHCELDDIEDVAIAKIRLAEGKKDGEQWITLEELKEEMVAEGLLDKAD